MLVHHPCNSIHRNSSMAYAAYIWPSFAPHIFLYCMPLHKGILYTAALDIYAWEPPNISYKLVRVAYSFNNVHIFKAKGIQYVHYIHRGRGLCYCRYAWV